MIVSLPSFLRFAAVCSSLAAVACARTPKKAHHVPVPEPDPEPEVVEAPKPERPLFAASVEQEPALVLIDGMRSGTNALDGPGLVGYWYTYSDGTGDIRPSPGSRLFAPTTRDDRTARECRGGGQNDWGAGFGFDLSDPPGAGGAMPFDATEYKGIRFDALSKQGPVDVWVALSDGNTNPRGGVCEPESRDPMTECNGDYGATVRFDTTWHTYALDFTQLVLPAWTALPQSRVRGFAKDKLYAVHFQRPANPSAPLAKFDLLVSRLYFTKRAPAASL
jgi:hypothetical protein